MGGLDLGMDMGLGGSGASGAIYHTGEFYMSENLIAALYKPFLIAAVANPKTQLTIREHTYIRLANGTSLTTVPYLVDTTFTVADYLDTGVIEAGKDYCVYGLDFIPAGKALPILVSRNSTFPGGGYGATANNSRKIGGYHTLCVAVGTISGHTLTDFAAAAILPASVWCLNHRPKCSPEGMAYSDQAKLWADIYLQSGTGAATASANGATITDTRTWMDHVDDLAAVGKRLLTDWEFQVLAEGSNMRTNIAGSADPGTTGGHSDTAGRRMISNYGLEDCAGAMYQWLQDNGYRYDIGTPTFSAASQTCTIYHAAAPGGNPIYVKFGVDGTPYLCCNMAADAVDKVLTFGTNYKLVIKHDAGAATGLPLYFDYDATLPLRFLVNNTIFGKDCYAFASDPNFMLPLKHNASAATNGVAVTYDDASDERLEYISPGAANATMDLCTVGPTWGWYNLGTKGQIYKQGTYGDVKLLAGGIWSDGTLCGPRCRNANNYRWSTLSNSGTRGCAEPL